MSHLYENTKEPAFFVDITHIESFFFNRQRHKKMVIDKETSRYFFYY